MKLRLHREARWRLKSPCVRRHRRSDFVHCTEVSDCRARPDAAGEGGDVDQVFMLRIRNDPIDPFEVESRNSLPGFAAVGRAPDRRFITSGINDRGVLWIDGYVIDVLVAGPTGFPGF